MITEKSLGEFRGRDFGDGSVYFLNEEPILQVHLFPDHGWSTSSKNRPVGSATIFWRANVGLRDFTGFLKEIIDFYFVPK